MDLGFCFYLLGAFASSQAMAGVAFEGIEGSSTEHWRLAKKQAPNHLLKRMHISDARQGALDYAAQFDVSLCQTRHDSACIAFSSVRRCILEPSDVYQAR